MIVFTILQTGITYAKLPERSKIINNMSNLLTIEEFKFSRYSDYQFSDSYEFSSKVKNKDNQKIEAYSISFIVFNYFDERIKLVDGVSYTPIKPGEKNYGEWSTDVHSSDDGLTGFTFIHKIRFEDGTIIKADINKIAERMNKILNNSVNPKDLIKKN